MSHGSRESFTWIIPKTTLCLVLDSQAVPQWNGYGVPQTCGHVDVHACSVCHVSFARKLFQWLGSLTFYVHSDCGVHTDTSWLELFWSFLHTTSLLPPIAIEGSWCTVDEDENLLFVVPPFKVLCRTWKRILDALLRGGLDLPVGPLIARVNSVAHFGGFGGFVPLSVGALDWLALQLSEASYLRDQFFSLLVTWPVEYLPAW